MTAQFRVSGNGNGRKTTSALSVSVVENESGSQALAVSAEVAAAINVHSHWFFQLQDAIRKGSSEFSPETVATDNACEFGTWLYGPLAREMDGSPIYAEIKELHARFHHSTAGILALALQGRKTEASSLIGPESEYRQLSGKLVHKLTELRKGGGS